MRWNRTWSYRSRTGSKITHVGSHGPVEPRTRPMSANQWRHLRQKFLQFAANTTQGLDEARKRPGRFFLTPQEQPQTQPRNAEECQHSGYTVEKSNASQ